MNFDEEKDGVMIGAYMMDVHFKGKASPLLESLPSSVPFKVTGDPLDPDFEQELYDWVAELAAAHKEQHEHTAEVEMVTTEKENSFFGKLECSECECEMHAHMIVLEMTNNPTSFIEFMMGKIVDVAKNMGKSSRRTEIIEDDDETANVEDMFYNEKTERFK